ncbi:tyrosine-type recombinase/integrase [Paraburkholderia phymatum]|uniref:Integrase family protein n=1 Tax=Paraburkholderia phymatum (strain DSM 17167 / CIP 108236 / LMG 21445 / STM815) TaxID=391038 RepID=B2JL49_PARP8|nr:tyrosine-type recombinase/integrase [Paraburkholderia phymatum]ACC72578.1 integrase family protein [Paraburkholderia phymatum STM815]
MANERINRELIRRLEAERKAKIAAGGTLKVREIYDDLQRGFGVRMSVKGSLSFVYRWTRPDGGQQRIVIGDASMTVEEARKALAKFIARTDHKVDDTSVRVTKHERRVADAKNVGMPTVGDYLDGDYRTFWLGSTRSETPEQNIKNIRRDFPDLMDRRLDEVTRPAMKKWIEKRLADGCKATGINRVLGSIGGLFSYAVEHEIIAANPCAKLRCKIDPEEDSEHGRELTAEEEQRLRVVLDERETRIREEAAARHDSRKVATIPGEFHSFVDHVKPAILLALNTGMRRSELLRARWTAIDWKAQTIRIEAWTSKVKRTRVIPMNVEALSILKAWRRQTRFEFIFTNEIGECLREVRDWNKIKREAQIRDFRFMDTRHHTATRMINEGASPYHVQKLLGHKDGRMTQRYMRARDVKLAEAVALLDVPRQADADHPVAA